MGALVARRYPTKLALGAADHTYVECGTGAKGWSCYGGKSGGKLLRTAFGSTRRADKIAAPDERAGISCYAINGVCHQCANRILSPAKATVRGARGYKVSEAIYGPYGRFYGPFGTCASPFDQYTDVDGDLPECAIARESMELEADPERRYLDEALAIYDHFTTRGMVASTGDLVDLHVELFMHMARYALGNSLERLAPQGLRGTRAREEQRRLELEHAFMQQKMAPAEFLQRADEITVDFQKELAEGLSEQDYAALLGLPRGVVVLLVDPDIAKQAYGPSR